MDSDSESCEYWFESWGGHSLDSLSGGEHLVVAFIALSIGQTDSHMGYQIQSAAKNEGISVSYADTYIFITVPILKIVF